MNEIPGHSRNSRRYFSSLKIDHCRPPPFACEMFVCSCVCVHHAQTFVTSMPLQLQECVTENGIMPAETDKAAHNASAHTHTHKDMIKISETSRIRFHYRSVVAYRFNVAEGKCHTKWSNELNVIICSGQM